MNVAEASSWALPVSRPPYPGPLKVRISAIIRSIEICSIAEESQPALERVDSRVELANRGDARQLKHQQARQVVKQRFITIRLGTIAWTVRFIAGSPAAGYHDQRRTEG